MVFKGDASVRIGGVEVEERATLKDLGPIVHHRPNLVAGKAVEAFHLIRSIICDSTDSDTLLNLYNGYIVPILSYGAILWKASKNELKINEILQKKTSKWMLRYCPIGYKERFQKLKLLPVSLYHELHVLLSFISIVNDKFRLDWKSKLEIVNIDKGWSWEQYKCKKWKLRGTSKKETFGCEPILASLFRKYFGVYVAMLCNYKTKLSTPYLSYFNRCLIETDMCSRQLTCNFADYRNIKKLELNDC